MALQADFDTEFAGPQAWALMYRGCGWQVVPALMPREHQNWKRPVVDWRQYEDRLADESTFAKWYGTGGDFIRRQNMGVIAGKCSGDLVVIDLDRRDGKDGFAWWAGLLAVHNNGMEPETPSQRTGGGGRQLVFKAPAGWTPPTFKTLIGVDIRGQGGFFVCPPSLHQSGAEYAWEPGREPWTVEPEELPSWAREAIDRLREEFAKNAGQGVERLPVGTAQDAFGLTVDGREERMANIIWGVCCDLKRELRDAKPEGHPRVEAERERAWGLYLYEVKTRLAGAPSNEEGLEREGRGRTAFMERWNRALAQWDGKLAWEASVEKPSAPPKPVVEGDGFNPWVLTPPPPFPLDCVPPAQAAYVEYETASLGADPAGIAMAMLTAMSGALDQRFRIKLRRHGDWYAPPRLWTMLVGESATKKTPIMKAALGPLFRIQHEQIAQRARDFAAWEAQEKADRGAMPPPATRFILNDVTIEAVAKILAQQDRGALMLHDELSGFVGSLDRYSNSDAAARAFWLTAHNGDSYFVDRVERSIFIRNLCVAFLGGIQPDRMRVLQDLMSDGLVQRFLPILIDQGPFGEEVESELPAMRYGDRIQYLAGMRPQSFPLTDEALRFGQEFRHEIFDLEQDAEILGQAFVSWLGKLPGVHGSLSLILHILENLDDASFLFVSEETARRAAKIINTFLVPHARNFYVDMYELDQKERLQAVGSYLLTSDKDRFTVSDLRWNITPLRKIKNQWEMNALLAPFISGGWLTEDGNKGWVLNPEIRNHFFERRALEIKRKERISRRFITKPEEVEHADQP